MEEQSFYTIKVLDKNGNWYDNAYIVQEFDALQVAKFYRDQLGYSVQLWKDGEDLSWLVSSMKTVAVQLSKRAAAEQRFRVISTRTDSDETI